MARHTADEATMTVGRRVRAERKARQLLQEELAARSGVTTQTVRNVEAARFSPTVETLSKIAGGLGVRLVDLLA